MKKGKLIRNKTKGIIMFVLIIAMTMSLMAGCTKAEDSPAGSSAGSEKYVINLAHVEPTGRPVHLSAVEFKEHVEEATNGNVEVNIYPNSQLGGDRQSVESVSLGSLEMTVAAAAVLSAYGDEFAALDLPYIFDTREATYEAMSMDGELGKRLAELVPEGITCLGFNDNGLRQFSSNVRPITKLEDFKGIKVRVMENPVYVDTFNLLGANATPMAFGELYSALQQGTVDAQENSYSQIYESKLHEVQKYISATGHAYAYNIIAINTGFLESLPDEYKDIVVKASKTYLIDRNNELEASFDDIYIEKLRDYGVEINEVSDEEIERFKEALQPLYEKYEKKLGKEFMDLFRGANK